MQLCADPLDPEAAAVERARRHHIANLKRRLALLRHHARLRAESGDGKSPQAVAGGKSGWAKRARAAGGSRILATELAFKRLYSFTTYETAPLQGPPPGGTWQDTPQASVVP